MHEHHLPYLPAVDRRVRRRLALLLAALVLTPAAQVAAQLAAGWQLSPGVGLAEDVPGTVGAVALAFVPNPGPDPESPLYLFTQLHGEIRVVHRNRSVTRFATIPDAYRTRTRLPAAGGAYGLHGLCFDPAGHRLYTTSVYAVGSRQHNRITLWESTGTPRWSTGRVVKELRDPFADAPVAVGHSIGGCLVGSDGKLWVGTGDGGRAHSAHDPDSSLGKILRLEPDLSAALDNPFYDPGSSDAIRSYVYTMGLRNPWALAEGPGGRIYVADNGLRTDRLVTARRGYDYRWNGRDDSLGFDNLVDWSPSIGPASMVYVDSSPALPFLERSLVIGASGTTGVIAVPLRENGAVHAAPRYLMRWREPAYDSQSITGTALGEDGLYVARMVYDGDPLLGPAAILKITTGDGTAPVTAGRDTLDTVGCLGCHRFAGEGSAIAPGFDGLVERIAARLQQPDYRRALEEANRRSGPRDHPLRNSRAAVLSAGEDDAVERWIAAKIRHPRFDDPDAQMPITKLAPHEIEAIAAFLATAP